MLRREDSANCGVLARPTGERQGGLAAASPSTHCAAIGDTSMHTCARETTVPCDGPEACPAGGGGMQTRIRRVGRAESLKELADEHGVCNTGDSAFEITQRDPKGDECESLACYNSDAGAPCVSPRRPPGGLGPIEEAGAPEAVVDVDRPTYFRGTKIPSAGWFSACRFCGSWTGAELECANAGRAVPVCMRCQQKLRCGELLHPPPGAHLSDTVQFIVAEMRDRQCAYTGRVQPGCDFETALLRLDSRVEALLAPPL
ncbi:unnamed protein product [Pedinophyceae sp. YPF-701]|nr:unnamed protein product [Pedinophyceae sp. YPF-701]